MTGGLLAIFVGFDYLRGVIPSSVSDQSIRDYVWQYRGPGVLFFLGGFVLAALTARLRTRDPRFRRAAMALGYTIVFLVAISVLFNFPGPILVKLSPIPIIVGILLLGRPAAVDWFTGRTDAGI